MLTVINFVVEHIFFFLLMEKLCAALISLYFAVKMGTSCADLLKDVEIVYKAKSMNLLLFHVPALPSGTAWRYFLSNIIHLGPLCKTKIKQKNKAKLI